VTARVRADPAPAAAPADPLAVIVEVVGGAEPALDPVVIHAAVAQVAASRHKRRRLAVALASDPGMLTDGRSTGPTVVWQLLWALLERGAARLAAPRRADCGQPKRLAHRRGGQGLCAPCHRRPARTACTGCGRPRLVATRDRHGRPYCTRCPVAEQDPLGSILAVLAQLEPALDTATVTAAVQRAAPSPAQQRRLAWALEGQPALLTGAGATAPPAGLRLIEELLAAGATCVTRPACPGCGRVVRLWGLRDGVRVCGRCAAYARAEPCAGCGAARPAVRRTPDGPLGQRCWRGPTTTCTSCGTVAPCAGTRTGRPRCQRCARPTAACVRCGRVARVAARHADGPWCTGCQRARPRRCQGCGAQARPFAAGHCARCALDRRVRALLSLHDTGVARPELVGVHQTLAATQPPTAALKWLRTPGVHAVLGGLGSGTCALSHAALDELAGDRSVEHLRAVLVAGGCLPARDEVLARLERWIDQTIAAIGQSDQQRLIRAFAVWHLLRRLRQRVGDGHATPGQAHELRTRVRAAIGFLDWLAAHQPTLGTCRQADLDRWRAAGNHSDRHAINEFLRWAVDHRLARDLDIPSRSWAGPAEPVDAASHWQAARRLLTDPTVSPADRVAGLLVLLYAQPVSVIARLTVDQVVRDHTGVLLRLGEAPVHLPAPLDQLVLGLAATRKGHAAVGHQPTTPWLFPGGQPGRSIGAHQLMARLHQVGIRARPARTAALLQLAAELPAVVLARLLGLHPNVAITWQQHASGQWTTYAAQFSRRGMSSAGNPRDESEAPTPGCRSP